MRPNMNLRHGRALILLITLAVVSSAATSDYPKTPEHALAPVTPESLEEFRAPDRVEVLSYQILETDSGTMPACADGMSDQGSATRALRRAFPSVPICYEWPPIDEKPRFPFVIDANERLVDVIQKLQQNTQGLLTCLLSHERIVVTAQSTARVVMDRPVAVDVAAETLGEALEQVEAAYNEEYIDFPLVVRPHSPRLMLRRRPDVTGQVQALSFTMTGRLRDLVLTVFDQMQDPALCYAVSDLNDPSGRRYFALHPIKDDAPELDKYVDADEPSQFDALLDRSSERLDNYFRQQGMSR